MTVDQPGAIRPVNEAAPDRRKPSSPEEAAKQFEAILVRQFVTTMTDGLFNASLAGDDGPGWIKGQQDAQRDVLTDVLTDHLVESGAMRLSDLLLRQWKAGGMDEVPSTEEPE